VRVNSARVEKAAASVKVEDVLTFPQGSRIRVVRVLALGERRGPAIEARALYDDLTPDEAGRPNERAPDRRARREGRAMRRPSLE
jgi:ribosome-associated heat shock protein Hsp15